MREYLRSQRGIAGLFSIKRGYTPHYDVERWTENQLSAHHPLWREDESPTRRTRLK